MTAEQRIIFQKELRDFKALEQTHENYVKFVKLMVKNHPFSYFAIVKNRYLTAVWQDICEKTSFLDEHFSPKATTRVYYYIRELTSMLTCETCGKICAKDISPVNTPKHVFCCNRCAQLHESTIAKTKATKLKNHGDPNWNNMEKNRATCLEKYGVECTFQAEEVKQKSRETIIKNYGVDHQMRSPEVKAEMQARYRAKHGVDCAFQNPDVQMKIIAKNQERLGVDWPMQNKVLHKIMHEHSARTQTSNFYANVLTKDPQYEALFTLDEWLEHGRRDKDYQFTWKCKKCGKTFKSRIMWGAATYVRCYDCYPVIKSISHFEQEIAEFARSLGNFAVLNHVAETKQLIPPKEVDIIVKDNTGKTVLGIEADGLYWHSAANQCDKFYHLMKTDACLSKGVQLVHVFEDEWTLKNEIVKSRISSLLGIYDSRIYARQCEVRDVSSYDARNFFDANHLQGSCNAKHVLGLWYDNEYVAMMSFGSRRKIMNGEDGVSGSWEMLRFACKLHINVIGGASRLLKHFERKFMPAKLTTYADRRWSTGNLYKSLGFALDHISSPNYWYLDSSFSKRIYRFEFAKYKQKNVLSVFDPNLTEFENMKANGYSWIWDCGNYVYVKDYFRQ